MKIRVWNRLVVVLGCMFLSLTMDSQSLEAEQHIGVSMRMIGHQLLLNTGDSVSRILPVQKEQNRYKIGFEGEFELDPMNLFFTVKDVIAKTGISEAYIVEIEKCDSLGIIHSFEVGTGADSDVIPCGRRAQPKDCYALYITLLDEKYIEPEEQLAESSSIFLTGGLSLIGLVGLLVILFFRKKKPMPLDASVIPIGQYKFDHRHMKLSHEGDDVELTSKEADLLYLLHSEANTTLEREVILNKVWGDEGDYVGRTLDVFISKLRKKLGADPSVKIANIRGVGYRLILE